MLDDLTRNAVDVLPEGGLEAKLKLGRPLRVKLGIDVTSPDIHIGRAIPLQRMRAFQDEGHVGVLIIGDYTTRIGDPSGRSAERPILSDEEIDANAKTYLEQAMVVLDRDRTEVRYNGEWLSKLTLRRGRAPRAHDHRRADARARRLREADGGAAADLGLGAALSADAGLRLGRDRGRRRARRHRPALQPARRPRGDGALRPRAAGRADDAAPPLVGRREDELVARQQHPAHRAARGDVRADDADPGRRCSPTGGGSSCEQRRRRPPIRWSRSSRSRAGSSRARTARRRRAPPRSTSRASCDSARRPTTIPEVALPDGDPVHLPALLVGSFGVASTSEARRLIEQGGVKLEGEAGHASSTCRASGSPGRCCRSGSGGSGA